MSRTRIKICGLTREADVDAAVEAGADAIGFVLYDQSPRCVNLARAGTVPSHSGSRVPVACACTRSCSTQPTPIACSSRSLQPARFAPKMVA